MKTTMRNLDGVYCRIKADDGNFENICFSDLTEEQQDLMLEGRSEEWLKSLCKTLAGALKRIGDQFDIVAYHSDDYEENF